MDQAIPQWKHPPIQKAPVVISSGKTFWNFFPKFRKFVVCKPGKGNSTTLWSDKDNCLSLCSLSYNLSVKRSIGPSSTLSKRILKLPSSYTSEIATDQLSELDVLVTDKIEDPEADDSWEYVWGQAYSSRKTYKHLKWQVEASLVSYGFGKVETCGKFFAWLLIRERLCTRNLLKRKNASE